MHITDAFKSEQWGNETAGQSSRRLRENGYFFQPHSTSSRAQTPPVCHENSSIFFNHIAWLRLHKVLAHREELINQAHRHISFVCGDLKVGIDQGRIKADLTDCDIVVASVSSLSRKNSVRIKKYDPNQFKCIIIDEAHHAVANSYKTILDYFRIHSENNHILLWGCSATPKRFDGQGLGMIFEDIVYHKPIHEMISEGYLCNIKAISIETDVDLSKVKTQKGDFETASLSRVVNVPSRNEFIFREWKKYTSKENLKSTLVFATDVEHAKSLQIMFQRNGVDAVMIVGETHPNVRRDAIEDFQAGKIPVLINCEIFTEGTDIPCIDCLVLARPTKSSGLFQQMLGRGMRLHPGKSKCVALDFFDSCGRLKPMTVPTLSGLFAVNESLSTVEEKAKAKLRQEEVEMQLKMKKLTVYWDLFSPVRQLAASVERKYRISSRNAWMRIGNSLVINIGGPGIIFEIKQDASDGLFYAYKWQLIKSFAIHKTAVNIKADSEEDALAGMDTHIRLNRYYNASKNARWRHSEASEAQQKFVERMGGAKMLRELRNRSETPPTKGQISALITILLYDRWKDK